MAISTASFFNLTKATCMPFSSALSSVLFYTGNILYIVSWSILSQYRESVNVVIDLYEASGAGRRSSRGMCPRASGRLATVSYTHRGVST